MMLFFRQRNKWDNCSWILFENDNENHSAFLMLAGDESSENDTHHLVVGRVGKEIVAPFQ